VNVDSRKHGSQMTPLFSITRGGAFAEWDFLRGVREEWIPHLAARNVSSASVYGTCEDILRQTRDDDSIVHEYPDPKHTTTWKGPSLDDDLVTSHGDSLKEEEGNDDDDTVYTLQPETKEENKESTTEEDDNAMDDDDDKVPSTNPTDDDGKEVPKKENTKKKGGHGFVTLVFVVFFAYGIKRVFFSSEDHRRGLGYSSVHGPSGEAVTMAV